MKTSRRRLSSPVRQGLRLGTLAAAGLGVAACGDLPEGDYAFRSVESCLEAGFSQVVCQQEYREALDRHASVAPRYDRLDTCEYEWGQGDCEVRTAEDGSGSYFLPFMGGFLVSSALHRITDLNDYVKYRRTHKYTSTPVYRGPSGKTITFRSPGTKGARPAPVNVNTRTVARSGFGGGMRSRSFGG